MVFPSSSTIRDLPVPEEFTMLACRANPFSWTRYTEIVLRSAFAASPLKSRSNQEFTGYYRGVAASVTFQTLRMTAYQGRTSPHLRMVKIMWLMQDVGFLDGNELVLFTGKAHRGHSLRRRISENDLSCHFSTMKPRSHS
jgi:hypothetical protein